MSNNLCSNVGHRETDNSLWLWCQPRPRLWSVSSHTLRPVTSLSTRSSSSQHDKAHNNKGGGKFIESNSEILAHWKLIDAHPFHLLVSIDYTESALSMWTCLMTLYGLAMYGEKLDSNHFPGWFYLFAQAWCVGGWYMVSVQMCGLRTPPMLRPSSPSAIWP